MEEVIIIAGIVIIVVIACFLGTKLTDIVLSIIENVCMPIIIGLCIITVLVILLVILSNIIFYLPSI